MDEPTAVELLVSEDGTLTPLSFTWQGVRLRVAQVGRQFSGDDGEHFVVMVSGDRLFELLRIPAEHAPAGLWRIVRTPSRYHLA